MSELTGPPVERMTVERITLPAPGMIRVEVVNDGPQAITVAQVAVDDAYWSFTATPSTTIPRLGQATFTIPYPWVRDELHVVKFVTSIGATFEGEIPAAVQSPQPSLRLFTRFGLLGLYVGIVPIVLGMLWYPLLRRSGRTVMNFVLCLTIGLLLYLAVSTWLDALEFAAELPVFWQGVPLVAFVALLTLGVLLATGRRRGNAPRTPLEIAYLIALGIGLHNLGEGLAIGAAFGLGEAALGTFLVLGFTLHNITEGVGIVAPLTRQRPPIWHFALLARAGRRPGHFGCLDRRLCILTGRGHDLFGNRRRRHRAGDLGGGQAGSERRRPPAGVGAVLEQFCGRGARSGRNVFHRFPSQVLRPPHVRTAAVRCCAPLPGRPGLPGRGGLPGGLTCFLNSKLLSFHMLS